MTAGSMSFKVNSVKPGVKRIGNKTFGVDAQGQFIILAVEVTNVGDKAEHFTSSQLKMVSGGKEYEPDATAAVYLKGARLIFEKINPSNTLKGQVVFDVPIDFKLESLSFAPGLLDTPVLISLA